ncbi:hypothetical protein [Streptomyces platensis]|uniref:hypothetical protein n=1 Tax=Streptomyces platensis TaxID=58346 RepID=UPI003677496B
MTADERQVLRSASLLDAFDLDLATQAAGLAHQAAARRLVERPLVTEDPHAIWPHHLHGAIRTALRGADDHTEDHWTPADGPALTADTPLPRLPSTSVVPAPSAREPG